MVGAHAFAPRRVHLEAHVVANPQHPLLDAPHVHVHVAQLFVDVGDGDAGAAGADHDPGVAYLAAGFPIKGALVADDRDPGAGLGLLHRLAIDDDGRDLALGALRLIAQEVGGAGFLADGEPHRLGRRLAGAGPGLAGLGALALHGGVEARHVDAETARAQRVLGEVEGEAEGIVQLECDLAGELAALRNIGGGLLEKPEAAFQGLLEARLLELQGLDDQRLGARQLGKSLTHLRGERRHQPPHHGLLAPHEFGVAHGAAHDPSQHVAAALVGGQHAVGNEEAGRPQVVGDDPMRHLVGAIGVGAGGVGRGLDQGAHEVGGIVVVGALQDGGYAFQPHAGVDGGLGQGDALLRRHLLILHEDQVPDLHKAVAVLVGAARRAAFEVVAMIVEDLRARTARAAVAHGPEVVGGGDADDALVGQPGDLLPQIEGLVVLGIDGDPQPVTRQRELLGHQIPGELDGEILEVVAERKVAEHLEKRVVARRVADVVQVVVLAAGAHALLGGDGARVVTLLGAGKDVLELHHAGAGEHQGGVVARHQRPRGNLLVAVAREVIQERPADVVGGLHGR